MKLRSLNKAFTLIELLVVISIIGMLSSVVLVSVTAARAKGIDSSRIQAVSQVRSALELYASNNNGIYPSSATYPTLESLIVGASAPLQPYLKALPSKIGSEKATQYRSDGTYYELYVTSETGGQFKKNVGCDTTNYDLYNNTDRAYCIGSISSGSAVVTPPAQTNLNKIIVITTVNGVVVTNDGVCNISRGAYSNTGSCNINGVYNQGPGLYALTIYSAPSAVTVRSNVTVNSPQLRSANEDLIFYIAYTPR